MTKIFLVIIFLLGSSTGSAAEVFDPRGILDSLSRHIKPTAFKDALTCNSTYEYTGDTTNCNYKCTDAMCQGECYGANTPTGRTKIKLFVENCTDTSASVYGENGWSVEVSKDDFDRGQGTLLIPILKNIGQYIQPEGDITLTFVMPMGQYDYVHNGVKERIYGVTVMAEINTGTAQKPSFEVVLAASNKGVPQVLLVRSGMDEFLRLKGVFDVKY